MQICKRTQLAKQPYWGSRCSTGLGPGVFEWTQAEYFLPKSEQEFFAIVKRKKKVIFSSQLNRLHLLTGRAKTGAVRLGAKWPRQQGFLFCVAERFNQRKARRSTRRRNANLTNTAYLLLLVLPFFPHNVQKLPSTLYNSVACVGLLLLCGTVGFTQRIGRQQQRTIHPCILSALHPERMTAESY